jgi:hypothetical protein
MALIACEECGKSISDRASRCPHCGVPQAISATAALSPIPPNDVAGAGSTLVATLSRLRKLVFKIRHKTSAGRFAESMRRVNRLARLMSIMQQRGSGKVDS